MKKIDWERANLNPTPGFDRAVVDALRWEDKPVKQKSLVAVFMTALIILALAATAYAIANRAGLVDFLGNWMSDTSRFTHNPSEGNILLETSYGDLEISVDEAVGDGLTYVFSSAISLKEGAAGVLRPAYENPDVINGNVSVPQADGPIYYVDVSIEYNGVSSESTAHIENPDGSISFSSFPSVDPFDIDPNMVCQVVVYKGIPGEWIEAGNATTYRDEFTLESPFVSKLLYLDNAPVTLGKSGVSIEKLQWIDRETDMIVNIEYKFHGGSGVNYELPTENGINGIGFKLKHTDGSDVQMTLLPSSGTTWRGGIEYSTTYSIQAKEMPNDIILEVYSLNTGMVYGAGELHLTEQ